MPWASSFARMNASIGLRTRAASLTVGTAGRIGFLNDHHDGDSEVAGAVSDHLAPSLIQSRIASTSAAVSADLPGGIFNSPSRRTAWYSRLCSALPGTIAGPRFPPLNKVARSRTSRSDIFVGPWQAMHFVARTVLAVFSEGSDWADTTASRPARNRTG